MGCPDWPTCFGSIVPPTRVEQLPADYKEQYAAYRDKKNQKFARYLSLIGMQSTADKLLADKSILQESDFNPTKTWTEYVNRLVGVAIGLLIIVLFLVSWPLRASTPRLFAGSLALLVLVIFQGWFGSIVVSTNLTPWTITIHMFLAIVMVGLLAWLLARSEDSAVVLSPVLRPWLVAGMVAFAMQIFLGTEVRAVIDRLSASTLERAAWIGAVGGAFLLHRTFSWVLIAIQAGLYIKLRKAGAEKSSYLVSILLLLCSVLTGSAMAYFGVPALMQPLHLLVAVIAIGWMYQLYLQTSRSAPVTVTA